MGEGLSLEALRAKINKKYGEGTIRTASEYPPLARVPLGIFGLDIDMGGGIPRGRVVIFHGEESSGKTTMAMRAVARFQRTCRYCNTEIRMRGQVLDLATSEVIHEGKLSCECGKSEPSRCLYLDVEGTFDANWAALQGVDCSKLDLGQPEYAEQAVDIVEGYIRTGEIDCIVIDSVTMLTPAVEIEKSSESAVVGRQAYLIGRMMRAVTSGFNSLGSTWNKPAVIAITQPREKVGILFGNPETIPGGRALRHAASIICKFRRGRVIYAKDDKEVKDPHDAEPIGVQLTYEIIKNKTAPPYRKGEFRLYTQDYPLLGIRKGDTDAMTQIIDRAIACGVIEQNHAQFKYGNISVRGRQPLIDRLSADPDLVEKIRQQVMERYEGEHISYHEAEEELQSSFGDEASVDEAS